MYYEIIKNAESACNVHLFSCFFMAAACILHGRLLLSLPLGNVSLGSQASTSLFDRTNALHRSTLWFHGTPPSAFFCFIFVSFLVIDIHSLSHSSTPMVIHSGLACLKLIHHTLLFI
jgi:hypothetical protein